MRRTALALIPLAAAIISAVQCVVSPGASVRLSATTRSATSGASGAIREGRVLSRNKPSTPSDIKRSCQRHTQVFDLPVCRMIAAVPKPSAENKMINARQTCFWAALRSLTTRSRRRRSGGETSNIIPVRIMLNRTAKLERESQKGLLCQVLSTRFKGSRFVNKLTVGEYAGRDGAEIEHLMP
jgi:hypothetical protein